MLTVVAAPVETDEPTELIESRFDASLDAVFLANTEATDFDASYSSSDPNRLHIFLFMEILLDFASAAAALHNCCSVSLFTGHVGGIAPASASF